MIALLQPVMEQCIVTSRRIAGWSRRAAAANDNQMSAWRGAAFRLVEWEMAA
ncbi:MAG: hypothetical protein K2Y20_07215 [Sphingomonas sp.]|nr:hypothetical protein [Sphingomonas sp.]